MGRKMLMSVVVLGAVFLGAWLAFGGKTHSPVLVLNKEEDQVQTEDANTLLASDQSLGEKISIRQATLVRSGFVVVMGVESGVPKGILGVSDYLAAGVHENIVVVLDKPTLSQQTIRLLVYADDGNKKFSSSRDMPALSISGAPVYSDIVLY